MMKYVMNEPVLLLDDFLIISDIHLGFEKELRDKGYQIPWQTQKIVDKIIRIKKRTGSKKLLILGDVKHNIYWSSEKLLRMFFDSIIREFKEVIIIKGNHDGLIENIEKYYKNIRVLTEFLYKKHLFIHGHKKTGLLDKADYLLLGHFHSSYEFENYMGGKIRKHTWKIYDFKDINIKKVISLPPFNEYFMGGDKHGPYSKYLELREVYTLNLVKLY